MIEAVKTASCQDEMGMGQVPSVVVRRREHARSLTQGSERGCGGSCRSQTFSVGERFTLVPTARAVLSVSEMGTTIGRAERKSQRLS